MDNDFVAANKRERRRLRALVSGLTDEALMRPMGDHWTVSVALAHLAFWDERCVYLLRKWRREGVSPSPIDVDVTNACLLALWRAIPPRAAANLAMAAAEAVDRELENLDAELVAAIQAIGEDHKLFRAVHRKLHLDQIEAVLK
jgi:hypothetical protein